MTHRDKALKSEPPKIKPPKKEPAKDGNRLAALPSLDVSCHKVKAGAHVRLDDIDTRSTGNFTDDKETGKELLELLAERLATLQEVLYAQGKHRLLIVLQAMDTAGKDSTIAHVFDNVNPQGVKVVSFKTPTPPELAHDYLWRVHPHVPGNGEIVIFNRSHYENVLIVRVHQLAPKAVWKRRYDHINAFEKMLVDEGTTILKFFLHISKEEQRNRLQARLDEPEKQWKFDIGDLAERKLWDEYQAAYAEAIQRTNTEYAPWYIVPSDRKWYRNLAIAQTIVQAIEALKPTYPPVAIPVGGIVID
jgi:PPK2 family polyphosphate:nucleotide phosphotransferase